MKRTSSEAEAPSLISSASDEYKPDNTPPPSSETNSKAIKAKVPSTPSPKKKVKRESSGSGSGGGGNGEWTPQKKEIFMDRVIATGYKTLDLGQLAKEVSTLTTVRYDD